MKKFKIYGFSITNQKVLITNSESISLAATFDEELKLQRYMKADFNFKIADTLESGVANPFIGLVYPGGKIRLEIPNKILDFIITNMSSEFYKDMIIYNVSCQDYASYVYAKQGQGLSLNYTGDLGQLVRAVLGQTRKNIGYRLSMDNYLPDLSSYTAISHATVTSSTYTTDYIGTSYVIVPKTEGLLDKDEYTFRFYVNSFSEGAQLAFGSSIEDPLVSIDLELGWNEQTFEYPSNIDNFAIRCITSVEGLVSISEIQLIYNIHFAYMQDYIDGALHLAGDSEQDTISFNKENFVTSLYENSTESSSYYRKATLILDNSNLYNGLIEIAKLYNAEIQFNYEENTVNFLNTDIENVYKGYRLSPIFNLLTLSREEDLNEFSSVLQVSGAEGVNIIPEMPVEFQQYFYDCVTDNFSDQAHFNLYNSTIGDNILNYKYIAENYVYNYIVDDENQVLRKSLIDDFAAAADFAPHLENNLYSLNYYKDTNKISQTNYDNFNSIINDDLRILNIKSRLYNNLYYNNQTKIDDKQNTIDFISKNLAVESIRQYDLAQKFDYVTVSAGTTGTNYWTVNKTIGGGTTTAVPLIAFSGDTGTVPSYINTADKIYYGKYISATSILLYEDSALTKVITIPINYTSTWYLYRAITYTEFTGSVLLANYKNYSNSLIAIKQYTLELLNAYNLNYNSSLTPTGISIDNAKDMPYLDTFTYYVLQNEGFDNGDYPYDPHPQSGGIHTLYNNLNNKFLALKNTNIEREARITTLTTLLTDTGLSSYQRSLYEQEKSGLEALIEDSLYYIGDTTSSPVIKGAWTYQLQFLYSIISTLSLSEFGMSDPSYVSSIVGLSERLESIIVDRQVLIYNLYKDYENYIIEGYYENTEEITSTGLLEQALTIFGLSKYPKITYGVSIIDISSLQDYEYIEIDIWDKILIQEAESRLYKTYIEDAKYLEVFEISMSLRKPEETKLTVSQEDQIKRILQKILFKI